MPSFFAFTGIEAKKTSIRDEYPQRFGAIGLNRSSPTVGGIWKYIKK